MEPRHDQAGYSQPLSQDDPLPPPPPPSQHPGNGHPHQLQLHSLAPPPSFMHAARTASSTPITSPGLFSPTGVRPPRPTFPSHPASDSNTPVLETASPYLHPLQNRKVRETHKALIDSDSITGRKLINQYEVIEEIGRGVHGKVKLARNLETGENVAIKIIPRYSKKRRLGKVMAMSPQDKTMREIAILKKMRHPNVVSLLEIIDDPELRKIYLILEHVELGEVVWRKKGLPHICSYERRRIETEMRGGVLTPNTEEEQYNQLLERRQALKELKRARMSHLQAGLADYWSNEHGVADDGSNASRSRIPSADDLALVDKAFEEGPSSLPSSVRASRATSRAPSRSQSIKSMVQLAGPAIEPSTSPSGSDMETPGAQQPGRQGSSAALEGTMYGAYVEERAFRGRSPSMADSIISHMSSVDWNPHTHDPFAEDFSYVPCFTFEQARSVFRDTVLGLEYLHYQGVVHRDIKPANLLWTKDHRVKISDFGVSYFGRPVREGEPDDEPVSESEAQDFDDDLELAKTVGTPAFFAPELCYTDVELTDQPKISEMIDIWSLGVTLYCLIFARIPFQAEDEWVMFKKIATEDVFIPTKRLKPVDPATHPDGTSLYKRHNSPPYRDDNDQSYEDIGPELRDLLQLMFTKNPEKRIRLREIKRHPWVTRGIANPIAWIDETDPARPSHGRRVQVDAKETAHAVVPITFLERARSVVKKAVGKVIHPLVSERSDSRSRRRATSSVASSGGDSSVHHPAGPAATKDGRKSIRGDDYFSSIKDFAPGSEHPLSQSVGVSPTDTPYDPLATAIAQPSVPIPTQSRLESRDASAESLSEPQARASGGSSTLRALRRRSQHPGGDNFLTLTETARQAQTTPSTPCTNIHPDCPDSDIRRPRDLSLQQDDISRSHSVDRALFVSNDKRAQPRVGLSNAVAPGTVQHVPQHSRQVRSIDWGQNKDESTFLESAISMASHAIAGYQHGQPQSDSNIYERNQEAVEVNARPQTAHRIEHPRDVPDARTPPPRIYNVSTPESFARAKKELQRRHVAEHQQQAAAHQDAETQGKARVEPAEVPCPPSPDDEQAPRVSREDTMETCKSSRSTSMAGLTTPLTSPSEVASPISSSNFPSKEDMLPFQSDPSLPALLSGASSSSADVEADLPADPTSASAQLEVLETTDSLTPPAIGEETEAGFPIERLEQQACIDEIIAVPQRDGQKAPPSVASSTPEARSVDVDYEDSDSDEGLLMARNTRKKKPNPPAISSFDEVAIGVKRRDTNASIASTETAKRFNTHGSDTASPSQQE